MHVKHTRLPLLFTVLALCFTVTACDMFGGDEDSPPEAIGKWEVEDSDSMWLHITEDQLVILLVTPEYGCSKNAHEITSFEENAFDVEVGRNKQTWEFEVENDVLTLTVIDAEDSESVGTQMSAHSVDSLPSNSCY